MSSMNAFWKMTLKPIAGTSTEGVAALIAAMTVSATVLTTFSTVDVTRYSSRGTRIAPTRPPSSAPRKPAPIQQYHGTSMSKSGSEMSASTSSRLLRTSSRKSPPKSALAV
jgi:hypothetical protein